ncbi:MAG TPA: PDZ domain-containing protein, partial [Candidatus Cloacimonadota bacterium]|nr:PDZ domain-containing protein [Candidatus Cloacimonadota bacterium]
MKKLLLLLMLILSIGMMFAFEPEFMIDPAISPDGSQICFSYMDDLWMVSYNGGIAKRLTSTSGKDSNPVFSPDGSMIAFNSDREGLNQIYIMPSKGGLARAISSERLTLHDWYHDNQHILASIYIPGEKSIFVKVNINDQKRPVAVSDFADSFAELSADDQKIIFNKGGDPYREAYKGSHNGDLFLYDIKSKKYTQLTQTETTERYPVFSRINKDEVYFCASDSKVFQIYKSKLNDFSKPVQLTHFDTWSPRDLSISNQDQIVFEYFNKIWKLDPNSKKPEEIKIEIAEDFLNSRIVEEVNNNKAGAFSVSPNGKLLVFAYKYDLFAVPTAGGTVKQITFNQAGIEQIKIAHDNESIFFTSFLKGDLKLYKTNINQTDKIEIINWSKDKRIHNLDIVNKKLYISYDQGEKRNRIAVMDSSFTKIDPFITENHVSHYAISNDSKYAVYTTYDRLSGASHVYFIDIAKKESRLVHSQLAYISSIVWDQNNKALFLSFNSGISRLDLTPKSEFENEQDKWNEILKNKSSKPVKTRNTDFDWSNIDNRFVNIVKAEDKMWVYPFFTTKDSVLYYISANRSKTILRKVKFDGKEDSEVFDPKADIDAYELSPDQKSIYYLSGKNISKLAISSKKSDQLNFKHRYQYDRVKLNKSIMEQVWAAFGNNFYDKNMHNQDWEKLYQRFSAYSDNLITTGMLSSVVEELIGEVNASHTGFYVRNDDYRASKEIAYTGMIPDFSDRPAKGIRVAKVYRNSALAEVWGIQSGDILTSIDGMEIDENTSLEKLLYFKTGEKIKMTFKRNKETLPVEIKGISGSEQNRMRYDNWVAERSQIVEKASKGQIGYLHIKSM